MGKIIETTYHDSVEKITGFAHDLVNNSFYVLNDKKPVIVTYYNIDKEASSLDPGSKIAYNNIGSESPMRFNKIEDFMIYGFSRIELQTEIEEFGLEADKVGGDAYILPNDIIPIEGDYFEVEHITDNTWLFIVTDVQQDTMKNGSNAYKISYRLEYVDKARIEHQVVENYKMIEKREGTNVVRVVKKTKYERAKKMDEVAVQLKSYFNDLFYNEKVQTFTYMDLTEWRVYDPYMIEFLIRNKILDNGEDSYICVEHQLFTPKTFSIDYDQTFFRAFETKDLKKLKTAEYTIQLEDIHSFGTTFASRFEAYFKAKYTKPPTGYKGECISADLLYAIEDGKLIEDVPDDTYYEPLWMNVLVKYFRDQDYTDEEVASVADIHVDTSMKMFYLIPLLILALEDCIENLLK